MRRKIRFRVTAIAACIAAIGLSATAAATASAVPVKASFRYACAAPATGHARCLSIRPTNAPAATRAAPLQVPGSYGPSDLQNAYALTSASATKGSGETIAIVDAYDDPDLISDLAVYRSSYGLPTVSITKYNEAGGTTITAPSAGATGWDIEESLDVDMVSAICPLCSIDMVEAHSTSLSDLATAANTAAELPGVVAVSNSYGSSGSEPDETSLDPDYEHTGIVYTVSAGDSGYGVEWPASNPDVTSVGGTTLLPSVTAARGWTESAWGDGTEGTDGDGTGSGCSIFEFKPTWQGSVSDSLCANRTVADVAADADPSTGVEIYDSYSLGGFEGFWGGTSLASPVIASVYALAGIPAAGTYPASYPYAAAGTTALNNIATGSNGDCGNYLCNGRVGYNGPTGVGTPEGLTAFTAPRAVNTITVTNPGSQSGVAGTAVTPLHIRATDSDPSASLSYAASGLPAGLAINAATGVISGTPTMAGSKPVTVTVTDGTGAEGTARFTWTVTAPVTSPHGFIAATKLPPLAVDDPAASTANGNPVQVWDHGGPGDPDQTWTVVSKGTYDVIELTKDPAKCLDVIGYKVANGTKIQLWSCSAGDVDQEWKPLAAGQLEAVYATSVRGTPVVLDDPNAGGDGTRLQIWQSNGLKQQFWTVP